MWALEERISSDYNAGLPYSRVVPQYGKVSASKPQIGYSNVGGSSKITKLIEDYTNGVVDLTNADIFKLYVPKYLCLPNITAVNVDAVNHIYTINVEIFIALDCEKGKTVSDHCDRVTEDKKKRWKTIQYFLGKSVVEFKIDCAGLNQPCKLQWEEKTAPDMILNKLDKIIYFNRKYSEKRVALCTILEELALVYMRFRRIDAGQNQ